MKKKMKLRKKILLGLLVLLAITMAALAIWQRQNIRAVYTFMTEDSETIADDLDQKRSEHQSKIEETAPLTVVPPSTEQSNAILSGATTPESVKAELGITEQLAKLGNEATAEDLINSCVAELYACKVDIMAELARLKQAAVDQWNAMPKETRTDNARRELGLEILKKCYDLEITVDAQVEEILSRYKVKLTEIGADTAILGELWDYYEDEKVDEKSYYMDRYLK